jgi:chromosomal replication initiation ATPase DnaA
MIDSDEKLWDRILRQLRSQIDPDEYRRWFSETSQASDSGDIVTVWVSSQPIVRHISLNYQALIDRALRDLDRRNTEVRFLATGYADDDEE